MNKEQTFVEQHTRKDISIRSKRSKVELSLRLSQIVNINNCLT